MGNILCLMGGSGSGKTVLAKKLEEFDPKKYTRVVEITTRPMREGELDGVDYHFISDKEYDKRLPDMVESVQRQFLPSRYGAIIDEKEFADTDKWYILVVSIEGFLSLINHKGLWSSEVVLVNILVDTDLDVQRENRSPLAEENLNKMVLENISEAKFEADYRYVELPLSELKSFRNDKEACLSYFGRYCSSLSDLDLGGLA